MPSECQDYARGCVTKQTRVHILEYLEVEVRKILGDVIKAPLIFLGITMVSWKR